MRPFHTTLLLMIAALAGAGLWCAPALGCTASAQLRGEAALTERVGVLLSARGVELSRTSGCPLVSTTIERVDDGLRVVVWDTSGRETVREVANAEIAAVLIESWARDELFVGLLTPLELPSLEPPAIAKSSAEPAVGEVGAGGGAGEAYRPQRVSFGVLGAAAYAADDASTWGGVDIGACVTLDPLCLGLRLQLNVEPGSTRFSSLERSSNSLVAGIDWPIRLWALWLVPGIDLGVGWFKASGLVNTFESEDEDDREEEDSALLTANTLDVRVGGHVRLDIPLWDQIYLELGAFADYSAFDISAPSEADQRSLGANPSSYIRGGVGLRYGR